MTAGLAISLLGVPVLLAFSEWSLGPLLCLATAIVQDPLRKLTPDHPVFFVGFAAAVFMAACLGAWTRGIAASPGVIFRQYRQLAKPFSILLLLIILQAFNSYLRFDNLVIPLLGLLTYVMPLVSICFAYQWISRRGDFRIGQFMKWYIVLISVALTTVYLEYSGYHSSILGQVGPKFIIFDSTGAQLSAFSGLFRASEIAAWHAMTAACFVVLITLSRRTSVTRLLIAVSVAAVLIGVGVLTGRRKLVIEFAVFAGTYFMLWAIFEKKVGKFIVIGFLGAAVAGYAMLATGLKEGVPDTSKDMELSKYYQYVKHSESVFTQAPQRFVELGIAPVMWAYDYYGLFGAGLGVGTQGIQHFGGGGAMAAAAEGGLGKITVELGIPGLFVVGWIAILFFRYLWQIMRIASRQSPRIGRLSFGLVSFLLANVAGFSVATQAYGDLFILLILSWTLGFLIAVPRLVQREVHTRQLATVDQLSPVFRPRTI
jgi:hypothetical protein